MYQLRSPGFAYTAGLRETDHDALPGRPVTGHEPLLPSPAAGPKTREIRISTIEFRKDHALLLDYSDDFGSGGLPFMKPEWDSTDATAVASVSYTMNKRVEVELIVEYIAPPGSPRVSVTITGTSDDLTFEKAVRLKRGDNTVRIRSTKRLPKAVKKIDLAIDWVVTGLKVTAMAPLVKGSIIAPGASSRTNLFVTMSEPDTVPGFDGVTLKRLDHAVAVVEKTASIDPHTVVERLMETQPEYSLGVNPANAWDLALNPGSSADCRTLVRYVINVLKMVGCPGTVESLLVYEKIDDGFPKKFFTNQNGVRWEKLGDIPTKDHFKAVAEPAPATGLHGGLNRPGLVHPNGRWTLVLFDWHNGQNNFEATLRYTHGGKSFLYPGGVALVAKGKRLKLTKAEEVIRVFKSLSWARFDDGGTPDDEEDDKMVPVPGSAVKEYKPLAPP